MSANIAKLSRAELEYQFAVRLEIEKRKCLKSLAYFVQKSWKVIEPNTPLDWNWHIDVICDHVQAFLEGRLDKKNLLINVPPGSMKSTIVSVCAPAWMWAKDPYWSGIFASGNQSVGMRDSIKCRDIIQSNWYQLVFSPDWTLSKDQNEKGLYKNTKTGFRQTLTAGGGVTGARAHHTFVDDPNDAQQIYSDAHRIKVNELWFDSAFSNRLKNMEEGGICLIQQRLHDEDLTGHILSKAAKDWEHLVIRSESRFGIPQPQTSLNWIDPRTKEGEIFFEKRYSKEMLEKEFRTKGANNYNGQYLQITAPASGNIIQKEWLQVDTFTIQSDWEVYLSIDCTFKDTKSSDYVSIGVWGVAKRTNDKYLIYQHRERLGFVDTKNIIKELWSKYKPKAGLIEDKANGSAILDEFKKLMTLIAILPKESKIARTHAITPMLEAKQVHLVKGDWNKDFIDECVVFPNGAHDDQVDQMTQFLSWYEHRHARNKLEANRPNITERY